jgi:hypothetical protein
MNRTEYIIQQRFRIVETALDSLSKNIMDEKINNNSDENFIEIDKDHVCKRECGRRSFFISAMNLVMELYDSIIKMSQQFDIKSDPLHMEFEFTLIESIEGIKKSMKKRNQDNDDYVQGVEEGFNSVRSLIHDASDDIKKYVHQFDAKLQ